MVVYREWHSCSRTQNETDTQCPNETWATDARGSDEDMNFVHLVYARRGAKHTGNRPELTALQQAIARDNERARSEVARAVGSTVH